MSESLIKILLQVGIKLLGHLIPALGSFLGGPLGWLAGIAISWLTGILFDLVERLGRYAGVDHRYAEIVAAAKAAELKWNLTVENPNSTKEEKEKALEEFKEAHRRFKFGPPSK